MREKIEQEKAEAEKRTQELLERMERYQQENQKYQEGKKSGPTIYVNALFCFQEYLSPFSLLPLSSSLINLN